MTVPIRELKRRYKTNLALGRVYPTYDRAIPLPLSTGNPLYDAALTDKLAATTTLNEPEHLNRGWHLVRSASPEERATLTRHAGALLNDYKLLLALRAWELGDEAGTGALLQALPWGWRFAFPTAAIKPAATIFTGWRRTLRFRLIDDPRFPALQQLFHDLLARAPGIAILKYRTTIKEAAALLHFRFEGAREKAIHDLCFNNGRQMLADSDLEPVATFLRARHALSQGGTGAFLQVLEASPHVIPLTSFMGLLGSRGLRLTDGDPAHLARLRAYAVRCASAIEALLRLKEWSPWLGAAEAEILGARVRTEIIERGREIPFLKVTKAFMQAPLQTRRLVLEPLFLPLLRHFGQGMASSLGEPGPLTFVQPGNVIHLMSFLLYTVLGAAMPTRLLLLYGSGVEEMAPLPLEEVAAHLADQPTDLQRWLLSRFGGLATTYGYSYDYPAISRAIAGLDPGAPLMLDLPFANSMDILSALLPFERVFNLNTAFGAPGEVCLAYDYYLHFGLGTDSWSYSLWSRYSDSAAQRFAEFMDRLRAFQRLAAEVPSEGVL